MARLSSVRPMLLSLSSATMVRKPSLLNDRHHHHHQHHHQHHHVGRRRWAVRADPESNGERS
jgi:hypothetical protein